MTTTRLETPEAPNELATRQLAEPVPLPNSQFIAQGVNIVRFDPNQPAGLSGYGTDPIFDLDVSVTEPNGQYEIPVGTRYQADPESDFESVSHIIKSGAGFSQSFSKGMDVKIGASGGPFGPIASLFSASFSASYSYRTHQEASRLTAGLAAESRAIVTSWILANESMPLTQAFQSAVAALPASFDRNTYEAFLDRFGTHYSATITFGGRGWQSFLMSSQQYTTLQSNGTDVHLAASVGFGLSVEAGTYSSHEQQQWNELSEQSESLTVRYFGGSNLSTWDSWAATVAENPLPVGIDLVDVSDLLTSDRFPSDPDIDTKRENLLNAITDYGLDVSDGLVETRIQPASSTQDEGVYRLAQLERHEFMLGFGGSSFFGLNPTAIASDGSQKTSAFFVQPVDGGAMETLRSGDVVFLGYTSYGGYSYLNRLDNNGVRQDSLNAGSKSFQWRILSAEDPASSGDPIAQGTPLLVQNLANGKVMVYAGNSFSVTGDASPSLIAGRMAFV